MSFTTPFSVSERFRNGGFCTKNPPSPVVSLWEVLVLMKLLVYNLYSFAAHLLPQHNTVPTQNIQRDPLGYPDVPWCTRNNQVQRQAENPCRGSNAHLNFSAAEVYLVLL